MKIKLVDGTEIFIDEIEEYYRRGTQKKYVNINFKSNFTIYQLLELFISRNISTIVVIDDNDNEILLTEYNTIFDLRIEYNKESFSQNKILIILTVGEE